MGGINSGRRANTPDTDQCLRLSLTDLRREGLLKRHVWARCERQWTWSRDDAVVGAVAIITDIDCRQPGLSISIKGRAWGRPIEQVLTVVAQPQPLGGERFYALCPFTGQRCTVLYLPLGGSLFASARGWGVPYASTREREVSRAVRTMRKIETQKLSKYARKPTRERQWSRWMKAADTYDAWEDRLMEMW
jgi:hypothetical protein